MPASTSQPLRSMTGFGRGAAENKAATVEVELRSVNGKGLSLKIRVPGERMEVEPQLEARARKVLERGTVHGAVRIRTASAQAAVIDHELLRRYLKEWRAAERELKLDKNDPGLADLLALPGAVMAPPETRAFAKQVERAATEAFEQALEELVAARNREGARLRKELAGIVSALKKMLGQVNRSIPAARQAAAERLSERVKQAWDAAGVTEPIDLTRELAVLAERADVAEETSRLEIHLERLGRIVENGGACGRELEFLIQECHREATTLGNKAADAGISQLVVDLKTGIQRFREQCANVE